MIFKQMPVAGAYEVLLTSRGDDRGSFARAFCDREMADRGMPTCFVQHNLTHSVHKGTLRGMHYQIAPHEEGKFLRCIRGRLFDFMVDLRRDSETYLKWCGAELSSEMKNAVFSPPGCAHAYLTLEDDTEAFYMTTAHYTPESERGVRWDDPAFRVELPIAPSVISQKDASWPDFKV
ncbi:MAG: dTDP-4-dehydrorhamnose 3,5-epimerase family protein [Pseudomonadota bacterium]